MILLKQSLNHAQADTNTESFKREVMCLKIASHLEMVKHTYRYTGNSILKFIIHRCKGAVLLVIKITE